MRASAQQRRPDPAIGVEMAADLDVLQHRQILEKLHELEGANEARRCDRLGRAAGDVLACEDDAAGIRRLEAGNQIEQRGLARTVWADQGGDATICDVEVDRIYGDEPAKPPSHALQRKERHALSPARDDVAKRGEAFRR